MPLDPVKVAETRAWLSKAALDLRAAEHERTATPPLTGDMVFHAQQLVEKSLKAFLSWPTDRFAKPTAWWSWASSVLCCNLIWNPFSARLRP